MVVSRDGASFLVVSYADISRCVEKAYEEFCNANRTVLESDFGGLDNMSQPPLFASGGSQARSGGGITSHHFRYSKINVRAAAALVWLPINHL